MAGVWNDGNAVLKDLTAVFEETRAQVRPPKWPKFCKKVESDGAYEKYIYNNTSGAHAIVLTTGTGSTITIANAKAARIMFGSTRTWRITADIDPTV